ncbi:hypothetical protein TIFTF001_021943, partial [Ficus carica]
IITSST